LIAAARGLILMPAFNETSRALSLRAQLVLRSRALNQSCKRSRMSFGAPGEAAQLASHGLTKDRFRPIVLKNSLRPGLRPDSLLLATGDSVDDGRTDSDAGGAVL
jgi:hypothetical protein